uniref:Putative non-LTR retroelement reverse transcriptase n=1 Tax=Arabidopsis thaliana TaxID=3702 RepID=Q9ZQE2_ARATH|nr:putative non-LTR retroelement reverse transcriptase [Arabidopsis thaliana]
MPKKKKKKLLRGVVTSSSKFAAVCARAASSVSSGVRDGSSGVASVFGVFGNLDFSDHVSCGVVLEADGISVKRPFKFYNFLLNNEEFLNVVIENWYSTNVVGSHMFRVSKKLKALKKPIKDFSRLNYSGIELRTKEAHEWFLRRQDLTLANASDLNAALELEAQRKWLLLSSAEESFFHQRSRVSWFAEGDSNTSYFHRMADSRKLQGLFSEVIGQSQSAFLLGRSLAENVLFTTEMVHGYNRLHISPWGMLKCHHRLRESSFWRVEANISDPWSWKMLLNLRPLAERFVKAKVGNVLKASFWFDNWTYKGPLIKLLGNVELRPLRIPLNAKVADAFDASGWRHPLPRSITADSIFALLSSLPAPLPHLDSDCYFWSMNGDASQGFSVAATWEGFRRRSSLKGLDAGFPQALPSSAAVLLMVGASLLDKAFFFSSSYSPSESGS